jgi:DNA-binding transcriptional ArsR family regulator
MEPLPQRRADASLIAAIHHPLRRRLFELLALDGPATASRLAEATGEHVGNISHHLKVLAKAGVIEEAPELAKDRRERWWRHLRGGYTWSVADAGDDPAEVLVATTAEEQNLQHHVDKVRQWFDRRSDYSEEWVRAAYSTDSWISVTPAELEELGERVNALIWEYVNDLTPVGRSDDKPADRERVYVFFHAVPARP